MKTDGICEKSTIREYLIFGDVPSTRSHHSEMFHVLWVESGTDAPIVSSTPEADTGEPLHQRLLKGQPVELSSPETHASKCWTVGTLPEYESLRKPRVVVPHSLGRSSTIEYR